MCAVSWEPTANVGIAWDGVSAFNVSCAMQASRFPTTVATSIFPTSPIVSFPSVCTAQVVRSIPNIPHGQIYLVIELLVVFHIVTGALVDKLPICTSSTSPNMIALAFWQSEIYVHCQ